MTDGKFKKQSSLPPRDLEKRCSRTHGCVFGSNLEREKKAWRPKAISDSKRTSFYQPRSWLLMVPFPRPGLPSRIPGAETGEATGGGSYKGGHGDPGPHLGLLGTVRSTQRGEAVEGQDEVSPVCVTRRGGPCLLLLTTDLDGGQDQAVQSQSSAPDS